MTTVAQTQSARAVLTYLAATALPDLPEELWDAHLWLYADVLPLLAAPLTGYETDRISMYTAEADGTAGVAVAVRGEAGVRVHVHGRSTSVAEALLSRCVEEADAPAEVSTIDGNLARSLERTLMRGATLAITEKLWTRVAPREGGTPADAFVRELETSDASLFDSVTFADGTRGWPGFRACLESGLRYFGTFDGSRLVSVVGLCRLSRSRSEIIGVGTIGESDRRKGYATAACHRALRAALAESRICTWTARADNEASVRTARRLGMRPYLTRYDLSRSGARRDP